MDDRIRKWGMLRSALSNGDVELLENYIKNSSWQAVNVSDSDGMTPLAVAVSAPVNALPMVKLLCKNGADPRLGTALGTSWTTLRYPARAARSPSGHHSS